MWFLYMPVTLIGFWVVFGLTDRVSPRKATKVGKVTGSPEDKFAEASKVEGQDEVKGTESSEVLAVTDIDTMKAKIANDITWLGYCFLVMTFPTTLY